MPPFDLIGFDADDTLWHNERLYMETQEKFACMLAHYHDPEWVRQSLYQTETRNMAHYGYGIKAFALSLIETAIELTEGRITTREVQEIIGWAKGMLNADVELLPGAATVVPQLAQSHRLMVITKGDLLDQERKIIKSGLEACFQIVEVVNDKTPEVYRKILKKHAVQPGRFLMIGNSLRSDVWPVLELGGSAVYVPYPTTWQHEAAEEPGPEQRGYYALETLEQLPALLENIER